MQGRVVGATRAVIFGVGPLGALAGGLNTLSGKVVNPAVAEALHLPATPADDLWGG